MEWNIQSRAHACQISGESFSDGDPYHTLLLYSPREGYQRLDVCQRIWEEQFAQAPQQQDGYVSHWQGVYRKPPPTPPEPIQKESAESLLRKLIERQEIAYRPAIYILAAMLERKRILRLRDQILENGDRLFIYEHVKTRDILTIPEVHLRLDQLESVQAQVASLLEHGLQDKPIAPSNPLPENSSESTASPAGVPSEDADSEKPASTGD